MNKEKLYLYICISLVVGTQVTLHNNPVYAYDNKNFNKVNILNKQSTSINLMSYVIDDTWTVIDTMSIPENETLDKVISDYIADGKTKFYIKNGEYILNESINISEPNVVIQGESKENTKIIQNNSTINAITVTADNAEVCNLTIDSSHGRIAFSTSDSQTINNVKLHDSIIYGSPNVFAVAFYGTPYPTSGGDTVDNAIVETPDKLAQGNIIENNEIYSELPASEADGVLFTKQGHGLINNNKIYGRRIAFYLSRDSKVTNNEIKDSSTNGIRCAVPALDNEISGNTIDNSKASGISLVRNNGSVSGDYRASNIDIKDNVISNSKYFGIEINNLKDSEISGNKLSDIAFNGIYLVLSDNLNVKENQIDNCSLSVLEHSEWDWNQSWNSGIFLDSYVIDSNFNNNTISQFKVDTATNKPVACAYGIKIQPENNNSGNTITYNTITGYFTDGIDVPETETISENQMNLIPTNLLAEGMGASEIHLSWDSIDDVSYNVYRSDSEDGEYSKVGSISGTSYEDNGLEAGKTYYYKVTAVNVAGESEKSSVVSAATHNEIPTPSLPGVPTGLQAAGLDESRIGLSWDNISEAQSYNIYRSDSENGEYSKVGSTSGTSYEDTELEAGSTYYYKITAVNEAGESEKSASAGAATHNEIPVPTLPTVPSGLQAAGLDESRIGLSWDNISEAQSYNIYRSDSENGEYSKVGSTSGTSYEDTGLEAENTYYYKVTAVNVAGESEKSSVVSAATHNEIPTPSLPGVPTGLQAAGLDESRIGLSWDNISEAQSYNIYRLDSEDGEYSKVGSTSGTSYEDTELEAGSTYYYKITAVNEAGESEKSGCVNGTAFEKIVPPVKEPVSPQVTVKYIYGNNRIETSIAIAEEMFKNEKPDAVVLASGADFPDALAGSVLAYKNNAPLLLVGKSLNDSKKVLDYIFYNLEKNKKIYVLGGAAAVNIEISDYLGKNGYNIVRLGGQNRYETNYKIIDSLNVVKGTPVIIVSANSFKDSLEMLSTACIKGYPILISTKNTLSLNAIKYIRSIQPNKVYIIGGEKILSPNIETEIKCLYENADIMRVEDDDSYESAVKIMNGFNLNNNLMVVASGINFPDAIVGSVLAARNNSNMLLADNNNMKIQKELLEYIDKKNLIILGGKMLMDINIDKLLKKDENFK